MSANVEIPGQQGTVGYKRPPQHTRFKKGESGNPSGRRKNTHYVSDAYHRLLDMSPEKRETFKPKNGAEEIALARFGDATSENDFRIQATKEITDRTEGKVHEVKDVNKTVEVKITFERPQFDTYADVPYIDADAASVPAADIEGSQAIQCLSVRETLREIVVGEIPRD